MPSGSRQLCSIRERRDGEASARHFVAKAVYVGRKSIRRGWDRLVQF